MRIATYHNQPSGGARRALHELGRRLAVRQDIDVFTLQTADEAFLSSRDYAQRLVTLPFERRRPVRLGFYANEARELLDLRDLERLNMRIARDIDAGGYDVALIDVCRYTQAPSVLEYLQTPAAYYCHEPPRRFIDTACRPEAATKSPYARARSMLHGPARALVDRRMAAVDRRNVLRARRVLTNSAFTRSRIRAYYGRDATVCQLGVDADRFVPGDATRESYVVSVGALEPHKGHDFLVRAIGRIPAPLRPRLILVGNTDDAGLGRRLEALARDLGVDLGVRVRVTERELISTLQQASAFVYAPIGEPFGLALLEAMACALPVVCVAEAGPTEIITDGETGVLSPRDDGVFATAVERVLADPKRARALAERARHDVERNWSWVAAAHRVEEELLEIAQIGRVALAGGVR